MLENHSLIVPTTLICAILAIPVLVASLDRDPKRRRDARHVLAELVRLLRGHR